MTGSKRSHVSSSSSGSMLKKRTACEFKKKLVEKRLMDLTNQKKKKGGSVSKVKDRPIICRSAMDRAQAIAANLLPDFPNFLKLLAKSHVTGQFRLFLPKPFCDAHLPKKGGTIVLLDENDRAYNAKYVVDEKDVRCRWKNFSTAHKLLEGDVLVFQLIAPCKFKIYIVRDRRLTETDATLPNQGRVNNDPIEAVKTEPEEDNSDLIETTEDKYLEHLSQKKERLISIRKRSSENSLVSFKDVKGYKDFSIYVDGLILDSEIPTHCREKYYELCKSQNMFLHENLVQGLNGKLAADMILETIKIADAIRAVDPRTGPSRMEGWDKILKAFEDLGMVVGFLRVRIRELIRLSREYGADIELMRIERGKVEEEMRAKIKKIDAEIDALCSKNEGLGPVFKETACAPW